MVANCTWATKTDLPELEEFIRHQYGPNSVQAQKGRFRWLFVDNPEGMYVLTGRCDGHLVAICGHLPLSINLNGQPVKAAYGVDFFVAPEYRRMGIGRLFLKERLKRFELSLSSGQSPAMANLYRDEKSAILGQFNRGLFVRRPQISRQPKALLRESIAWSLGIVRGNSGQRKGLALDAAVKWLNENQFPKEMGVFFPWRFAGPIYQNHQFFLVEAHGQSGVLVTRREAKQEIIVALYCNQAQRSRLLGCAARTSTSAAISLAFCGEDLATDLKKQGFLVRPTDAWVVAMSKDSSLIRALKEKPWSSFAADSDSDLLRLVNPNHA